jgi:feruloyl-CoA synthase
VALVVAAKPPPDRPATLLADLRATDPAGSDAAAARVGPDTVAKILFTSGSTGLPKGVVNTQRMICANQQQILQAFPFMAATPPVIVDWLPWNHTFGGNHNFGLVLYNGGSLYIDDGKPVPGGMDESIRNLREIAPTVYFNVPKGYEELVRHLRDEPDLRRIFFSRVQLLFYSGAGLAQHVWDALEKLVPVEDKMEARVRGPNIMPGYWRAPAATRDAFDEEGFYKFGDALRFVDPARPDLGFAFDGRITEDFKLSTGTWVSVGPLRARLVQRGAPWVRDAVIAGINQDYVAVLIVPDAACAALPAAELHATLRRLLRDLAAESTGSSNRVVRALVLHDRLDIDAGEVTDKGSLNQRAVLRHRADKVAALYADPKSPDVISIENDAG